MLPGNREGPKATTTLAVNHTHPIGVNTSKQYCVGSSNAVLGVAGDNCGSPGCTQGQPRVSWLHPGTTEGLLVAPRDNRGSPGCTQGQPRISWLQTGTTEGLLVALRDN